MDQDRWTGVVLVGGGSTRMGEDKALLTFEGRTFLDRALDVLDPVVDDLLVIGDPAKYGHVGPFVIADESPGKGPLGGLVTAMRYTSNARVLLLACDMLGVTGALLLRLKELLGHQTDAVVPRHHGRVEPLAAAYDRRCLPVFARCVNEGVLKMGDALALVRTSFVETIPGTGPWPADLFRNVNSPADL